MPTKGRKPAHSRKTPMRTGTGAGAVTGKHTTAQGMGDIPKRHAHDPSHPGWLARRPGQVRRGQYGMASLDLGGVLTGYRGCRNRPGDIPASHFPPGAFGAGHMTDEEGHTHQEAPKGSGRQDVSDQHLLLVRGNEQTDERGHRCRPKREDTKTISNVRPDRMPVPIMHQLALQQQSNHQRRKDLREETGQLRGHMEVHAAIIASTPDKFFSCNPLGSPLAVLLSPTPRSAGTFVA